jgi:ketosteroid isomerase-like protein
MAKDGSAGEHGRCHAEVDAVAPAIAARAAKKGMTMPLSNITRAREYLQAVASLGSAEAVAAFYSPDIVFQEFPNRIAPHGRTRRVGNLGTAYEQGKKLLRSQEYKVLRAIESGDEVAVELEWTGMLAIPVMNLPAGAEMKAFVAMFLTFRDGKIVSQRNYDCYLPFEA